MQKFFTDTLISRFIKYLLSVVDIPLIDTVSADDYLHKDVTYIYNNKLIKCTSSGYFYPVNDLFPSYSLYPAGDLYGGDITGSCSYTILDSLNSDGKKVYPLYKYHSNASYYDSETHKHLGQYLRYLRDTYNVNLMPYYNCFANESMTGITLQVPSQESPTSYINYDTATTKILAVPIKFNKTYTIALESTSPVLVRSVIMNSDGHVFYRDDTDVVTYYSDSTTLQNSFAIYPHMRFNEPQTYRVALHEDADNSHIDLYSQQSQLYMLIQVDITNNSSVVVLEGDYTNLKTISCENEPSETHHNIRKPTLYHNLSLLQFNTGMSYPFATRLVEYLLNSVICKFEELPGNVAAIQNVLHKITQTYNKEVSKSLDYWLEKSEGVWNDSIPRDIHKLINKWSHDSYMVDMDNNVNVDIKKLLYLKEGLVIGSNS